MNMYDKYCRLKNILSTNDRNLLYAFLFLQIYFAGNILSFIFWKSSISFGYTVMFYGVWLMALTLFLLVLLILYRKFWVVVKIRPGLIFCVILSIPFGWQIWLQSLELVYSRIRPWLLFPFFLWAMYMYYHFAFFMISKVAIIVILLSGLSFIGHSNIGYEYIKKIIRHKEHISSDLEKISLDNKPNIHVIMIDSLTHSKFTNVFLGTKSPAADYLATLDNTIYASNMGFSERVFTKRILGDTFRIG